MVRATTLPGDRIIDPSGRSFVTTFSKLLVQGSAAAMAFMLLPGVAHAQAVCENESELTGDGPEDGDLDFSQTACGNNADTRGGQYNTAIGAASAANGVSSGNTSVGAFAKSTGSSDVNPDVREANTALGYFSDASGDTSSNAALGTEAKSFGSNSQNLALGNQSNATGNGAFNIAIGSGATAVGNDGSARIAIGSLTEAIGNNGVSMGYNARANGDFSVAIGAGAVADDANTVSFGSAGVKRRLVNVAAGNIASGSTDAVNGGQLFDTNSRVSALEAGSGAALGVATAAQEAADDAQATADTARTEAAAAQGTANTALADAATAQGTADTALANAATAQDTADEAIDRGDALGVSTAAAFGGGSIYDPATATISAPSYAIGTINYNNAGAAFQAANTSGLRYFHTNSTLPDGTATGVDSTAIGSAQASGDRSIAFGMGTSASGVSSVAIGDTATASADGAVAVGANSQATGVNAIAIGTGAVATGSIAVGTGSSAANGGAAFGDRSVATGANAAALGPDASATADNAVAIGSGSVANQSGTVSVGTVTTQRRIVNVAAGTAASDAATVGQLQASGASIAAALGGGSAASAAGLISAPTYAVAGQSYNNVGGALTGLSDLAYDIRKEARSGIAAALAMGTAPLPSAPGRTSYVANVAEFSGEVAFGASLAHRLNMETNLALTAGYSRSTTGEDAFRAGVAGEF